MAEQPSWWTPPWEAAGTADPDHPSLDLTAEASEGSSWCSAGGSVSLSDEAILSPLEAEFGQIRSRERVRDLAEVFTHQREVDAMLALVPDAFGALDVTFLEPTCGSGNFLVEVLRRKLALVRKVDCRSQEHYEHRLLRAAASVYGVDISSDNVAEARGRLAHTLLDHYQRDANTVEPTEGFLHAAALVLGANVLVGDALDSPDAIEVCEWRPFPNGRFQRVWSYALVPEAERNLFWQERVEDPEPVHYAKLTVNLTTHAMKTGGRR